MEEEKEGERERKGYERAEEMVKKANELDSYIHRKSVGGKGRRTRERGRSQRRKQ